LEAAKGALNFPPFLPPVTYGFEDDFGRLWLQREDFQPGMSWLVLDANLRPVGQVSIPRQLEAYATTGSRLFGTARDVDDSRFIVEYLIVGYPP
jgi:hypothetical protein